MQGDKEKIAPPNRIAFKLAYPRWSIRFAAVSSRPSMTDHGLPPDALP
jgi:hypothetical protein